jgi:hypothetical protein
MPLSIGVLIIGSLYWEPNREAWRQERLRMDQAVGVCAPIRYGRKSGKRADTHTMVFSKNCAMGQAKTVPCLNYVATAADLVAEAEELWAAEDNKEQPEGLVGKNWGCVTLLVNPARDIPAEILDGWAERVSRQPHYGNIEQAPGEGVLVGERGILQIAWPTPVRDNSPLPLDLLLATATRPTLTGDPPFYPTPEMIADAWRNGTQDNVRYFRNNVKNGICTFEDDTIRRRLDGGCWNGRAVRSFTR